MKLLNSYEVMQPDNANGERDMGNSEINKAFFSATDAKTRKMVLANIANHYGITSAEAYEEVTDEEAEHLLDYVTGPERAATSVLMQRHKMA